MQRRAGTRKLSMSLVEARRMEGLTKLVAARVKLEVSLQKNGIKRLDLEDERYALLQKREIQVGGLKEHQEERLTQLDLELAILDAQNDAIERRLDLSTQLYDTANQALETGLSTGIADLLKGKEKSLKDTMLKIAESVVSAMIDTMAKDWAMKIMKKDPLDAFIKGGQMVHDKIIEAFQTVTGGGTGGGMFGSFKDNPQSAFDALGGNPAPTGNVIGIGSGISPEISARDAKMKAEMYKPFHYLL